MMLIQKQFAYAIYLKIYKENTSVLKDFYAFYLFSQMEFVKTNFIKIYHGRVEGILTSVAIPTYGYSWTL